MAVELLVGIRIGFGFDGPLSDVETMGIKFLAHVAPSWGMRCVRSYFDNLSNPVCLQTVVVVGLLRSVA